MLALAWAMVVSAIVGLAVTMPLWILGGITDRQMIGVTLALSWAALLYEGVNAVNIELAKRREPQGVDTAHE